MAEQLPEKNMLVHVWLWYAHSGAPTLSAFADQQMLPYLFQGNSPRKLEGFGVYETHKSICGVFWGAAVTIYDFINFP